MAKMGRHDNYVKSIITVGYYSNSQNGRVVSALGISPCCANGEKDGMPKVVESANG